MGIVSPSSLLIHQVFVDAELGVCDKMLKRRGSSPRPLGLRCQPYFDQWENS
jgi:hypothetical protein